MYGATQLARFRAAQRVAFDSLVEVRAQLVAGMTEREACDRIARALAGRGVRGGFHRPYAWFGDRTTLRGMVDAADFAPTDRTLAPGMPVILDAAPVLDGACADVALSCALGDNPVLARARAVLRELRASVLADVRAERTVRAIYRRVDATIRAAGFASWHARYPLGTLGHRVTRMRLGWLRLPDAGLAWEAIARIRIGLALGRAARTLGCPASSPVWNDSAACERPVAPGLWAVEPHLGTDELGAKFEELLVVTRAGAAWLDDHVPHVRDPAIAAPHRSIA
jgi:Xaa-Pro aminopeptidase